ncbi:MAG: hypothetical protein R2682_01085 [Pyrinomonadaceae bacterium]
MSTNSLKPLPECEFDHSTINRLFSRGDFVSESNNAINNAIRCSTVFQEDCLQPDNHLEEADDLVVPILTLYKDYRSSLVTNGGVMTVLLFFKRELLTSWIGIPNQAHSSST